ncbi:hypothetical protein KJZ99_02125 [bacterium]|nr:hypothetical protein [bacterium]
MGVKIPLSLIEPFILPHIPNLVQMAEGTLPAEQEEKKKLAQLALATAGTEAACAVLKTSTKLDDAAIAALIADAKKDMAAAGCPNLFDEADKWINWSEV